jgi:hypothetical protein
MAAMTNDFSALGAPDSGLWPVSKKPEDKTKGEFVRLVWRELTPDAFTTIQEFDEWFKKTLVPRTIESLGGPQVGRMLLHVTFNHGGVAHFMRWVLMKFTTPKSPHQVAAAAAKPAAKPAAKFEGEPEIEQDRVPEGTQLTPYKFPLNVDDVSAWQELLDASAGDEQAQKWYKSMLHQAEQRAAAANSAAAAPGIVKTSGLANKYGFIPRRRTVTGRTPHHVDDYVRISVNAPWVDCTNHPHDQDDVDKNAMEDRFIFMYGEPAAESAAAAPSPKPPKPAGLAAMMDYNNRVVLEVLQNEGPQAAEKAMMDAANGDYGEMRMMYG